MIKRLLPLIALGTLLIVIIILIKRNRINGDTVDKYATNNQSVTTPKFQINPEKLEINGLKVVGLPPGREKQTIQNLKVVNKPSEEWKTALEKTLKTQGGEALRDLKMDKVDSFVWVQDDIALFVESVLIQVKNDKNVNIKFRILVDAETGKILQNWDRPVIDLFDPKSEYKLPVDPRYHSE